jgi:hypothetical protein
MQALFNYFHKAKVGNTGIKKNLWFVTCQTMVLFNLILGLTQKTIECKAYVEPASGGF